MSTGSKTTGFITIICMIALMLFGLSGCGKDEKDGAKDNGKTEVTEDLEKSRNDSFDSEEKTRDDSSIGEDSKGEGNYFTPDYVKDEEEDAKICQQKMISLSGNKSDVYKMEEDCYYKGDYYIIYFTKDCVVSGDVCENIENVMDRCEELYGMGYNNYEHLTVYPWRKTFTGLQQIYNGLNQNNHRVNIVVIPDVEGYIDEYADDSVIFLYDKYLDMDGGYFGYVIAGLARALRQRQGGFMGEIFERGVALYTEEVIGRENNIPDKRMPNLIDATEAEFNKNDVINDPSGVFKEQEEGKEVEGEDYVILDEQYLNNYGYRFVSFLIKNYGPEIVKKISNESLKYDYDYGFVDIEFDILKGAAGDDVFDKFSQWLINDCDNYFNDYKTFLNSVTAE